MNGFSLREVRCVRDQYQPLELSHPQHHNFSASISPVATVHNHTWMDK